MKSKIIKYVICFGIVLSIFSCDDFLDNPISGSLTDDNIGAVLAANPSQVSSFLEAAYRNMCRQALYGREISLSLPALAHEVDLDYTASSDRNEFSKNDMTSSNALIEGYYQYFYEVIKNINFTIDMIDKMDLSLLSQDLVSEMNNYKGEALFMRAFTHFTLLNMFGEKGPGVGGVYPNNKEAKGIVMMMGLATAETAYTARSTVEECFEGIISDLTEAKKYISDKQIPANTKVRVPGSLDDNFQKETGWAQKPAVTALLGKVYLYMNNFQSAKTEFEAVIGDSRFKLDRPVNFVDYIQHNDNSIECIFALQFYDYSGGTRQHQIARVHTNVPNAWMNSFIDARTFNRFGSDPRLYEATLYDRTWSKWSTASSGPIWKTIDLNAPDFRCYPRKCIDFYDYGSPRDNTKNIEFIRLADVYLMYAEAVLQLGETSLATEYVNKVRRRAWGETDYNAPGTKGEDLSTVNMSIIQEERYKELFFENDRWFDLCRWQILKEELQKYPVTMAGVVTYNDHDYYMPIPESEINSNMLLKQSKGY